MTFEETIAKLRRELKQYKCHCNSDQNLELIRRHTIAFFEAVKDAGDILVPDVTCNRELNPLDQFHQTKQLIVARFSFKMPVEGFIKTGMIYIRTDDVEVFTKMFFDNKGNFFPTDGKPKVKKEKKSNSTDDYDRAMKGIQ